MSLWYSAECSNRALACLELFDKLPSSCKHPDLLICASCNDGVRVEGKHSPDVVFMLQDSIALPLSHWPYSSFSIPATAHNELSGRIDIQGADVLTVAQKQRFRIVFWLFGWLPYVNDHILSSRYY